MQDDFGLMQIKTPVIQIPDEKNSIYVKRDDLLPFSFGGNKVRIALEFINDMKKQGKDCIVGYGNARSNLSRALANLCYQFKIPLPYYLLRQMKMEQELTPITVRWCCLVMPNFIIARKQM